MKKKIIVLTLITVLALSSCSFTKYGKAQKAFEQGDFVQVLMLLEEKTDDKSKYLYDKAKLKVFENDLKELSDTKDTVQAVQKILDAINYFKDTEKSSELETTAVQVYTDFITGAKEYSDYKYVEDIKEAVKAQLPENKIVTLLETMLAEHGKDKLKAALIGTWTRQNDSMAGTKIEITFSDDVGQGILTDVAQNKIGFVIGDVKWNEISIFNDERFSFEDLCRYESGASSYDQANGKIDYSTMTISSHSTGYGTGKDQVWIKDQQ